MVRIETNVSACRQSLYCSIDNIKKDNCEGVVDWFDWSYLFPSLVLERKVWSRCISHLLLLFLQGNRSKVRHMSGSGSLFRSREGFDEKLILFHRELTDTCIDLMCRFAYVSCSARPKRYFLYFTLSSAFWNQPQYWNVLTLKLSKITENMLVNYFLYLYRW